MPKKAKRRPIRRRPQDRSEEVAIQQRAMDMAARGLADSRTPDQLRSELTDRELLLAEADRESQLNPSPQNLARYRMARTEFEAARRALALSDARARDVG